MTDERPIVVALGDSLTAGHVPLEDGWPEYHPWTDLLAGRFPGFRFANAGLDGDTVGGMASRLASEVLALHPRMCVVLGGTNDLGWGRSAEAVARDLLALWDRLRSAGIEVVACSVPPAEGWPGGVPPRRALNGAIASSASALGIPVVDLFGALALADGTLDPRWSSDGLHLTPGGYDRVGEAIAEVLASRLAG